MHNSVRLANMAWVLFLLLVPKSEQEQVPLNKEPQGGNPFTSEFDSLAKEALEYWKVPGFSIAVIDSGKIYAKGYGMATLPDRPATEETIWYGASTSKAHLAAAIAYLIENGSYPELSRGWNTPIVSIIGDSFALQDGWATAHLTLNDAVAHRTGMTGKDMATFSEVDGRPAKLHDIVWNLRNLPMNYEPRIRWAYSNLMYTVLSHVVETVTGKWLGDILREVIWDPLNMNSTFFDLGDAQGAPDHLANGYYWDLGAKRFKNVPFINVTELGGSAAVFSNVLDYAKWLKYEPFSENVHADIRTPRAVTGPPAGAYGTMMYGLGWELTTYQNNIVYKHDGAMHAYGAHVVWMPDHKYGVVSFGNTAQTSNALEDSLTMHLIEEKLGISLKDRYNVTEYWTRALANIPKGVEEAVKMMYPNLPDSPLPSITNITQLAGKYTSKGYGSLTLRVTTRLDKPDEEILEAYRPELTGNYQVKLYHVSGPHWLMVTVPYHNFAYYMAIYNKGRFGIGVDGKAVFFEYDDAAKSMSYPPLEKLPTKFIRIE